MDNVDHVGSTSTGTPGPIFLSGMMGSGKSRVARELERIGPFRAVDLDAEIEASQGRRVAEIFAQHGEANFRAIERDTLVALVDKAAAASEQIVIALGGGAVLNPSSRTLMSEVGHLIWLDVPVAELVVRLAREVSVRPLLTPPRGWGSHAAKRELRSLLGVVGTTPPLPRHRPAGRLEGSRTAARRVSAAGLSLPRRAGTRADRHKRPLWDENRRWLELRLHALLAARSAMYEAASIRVDGRGSPQQVAQRVLAVLGHGPP